MVRQAYSIKTPPIQRDIPALLDNPALGQGPCTGRAITPQQPG